LTNIRARGASRALALSGEEMQAARFYIALVVGGSALGLLWHAIHGMAAIAARSGAP